MNVEVDVLLAAYERGVIETIIAQVALLGPRQRTRTECAFRLGISRQDFNKRLVRLGIAWPENLPIFDPQGIQATDARPSPNT